MKTLKLLLIMLLAASGTFAQQLDPNELSLTISSKKNSMPYNKILVDVEIRNISNRNIKLLDYFKDKENWRQFFRSSFGWTEDKTDSLTGEKSRGTWFYGGGRRIIAKIELEKPGEALKYITLKPQQAYKFTMNLSDLFFDLSREIRLGLNTISISYANPKVDGCEWCFKKRYTSNNLSINITN